MGCFEFKLSFYASKGTLTLENRTSFKIATEKDIQKVNAQQPFWLSNKPTPSRELSTNRRMKSGKKKLKNGEEKQKNFKGRRGRN
jgi:hypothetical protein